MLFDMFCIMCNVLSLSLILKLFSSSLLVISNGDGLVGHVSVNLFFGLRGSNGQE